MSLFNELKRRNVFRVGIAYVVVAWLLAQVVDLVLDNIESPDWVMQVIMLVLGIGFPLALFFAWAFEVTPEGIKKEKEVDRSVSITHHTGRKLDFMIIAVLVAALGYFAVDKFVLSPGQETAPAATELEVVQDQAAEPAEEETKSIAVLPFANRSNREEDEFFTEGIHDDLLTHLAKIGSMKVISRTSVLRYKNTEKSIPEIAAELKVATILEGGIQRSGEQVRINVQLIDAKTDEHLWAEIFDRQLTAENLFAIQSEIATEIASALEATLSPEVQSRLADVPTTNMAAYNAYLRARQLQSRRTSADLEQALAEYTRATELDPGYALAWVGMAEASNLLSGYGSLAIPESMAIQERAVSRALEINDELGEAYASQAVLYSFKEMPVETEAAYLRAIELSPNYASAYHWYSGFISGYSDRLDESIAMLEKAADLDPLSSIIQTNLGSRQLAMGRYEQAEKQYLKVIELDPDFAINYSSLAGLYSNSLGQFAKAIKYNRIARQKDPGNVALLFEEALTYLDLGDYDAVESLRQQIQDMDARHWTNGATDIFVNISKENYAGAIEAGNWVLPIVGNVPGALEFVANAYFLDGQYQTAREMNLQAKPGWQDPDQWIELIRDDMDQACLMAYVFIKTGDQTLAERLMNDVLAHYSSTKQLIEHSDRLAPVDCWLARGEFDKALTGLETLVAHKHYSNFWFWLNFPQWDPVRAEPRYQAAIRAIENGVAEQRRLLAEMNLETDA